MKKEPTNKTTIKLLDSIVDGIAQEELRYLKDTERHNREIARLRTQLGQVRAFLNRHEREEV